MSSSVDPIGGRDPRKNLEPPANREKADEVAAQLKPQSSKESKKSHSNVRVDYSASSQNPLSSKSKQTMIGYTPRIPRQITDDKKKRMVRNQGCPRTTR